jgi:hypothetical protein
VERGSSAAWFPGDAGDAEATTLQRNNFSQLLPFSNGDLLRRQRRGWVRSTPTSTERLGRPVRESRADASSSSSGDDVVDPVNLEKGVLW